MATTRDTQAPTSVVHTDGSGTKFAQVATTPPVSGVDMGVPVYANLGSAVVPVAPSSTGVGAINSTGQVSVGATDTTIIAANASRAAVIITNISSTVTVYIGNAGLTTSTGYPLLPSNSISIPTTAAVHGIVASSTQTVGFLEIQ